MSFDPLFAAPAVIQVHAFAAMGAFLLGLVQFAAPKGTLPHRTLGYIWAALMLVVAGTSFAIHGTRQWWQFSPIHVLSVVVVVVVPLAVLAAHRHNVNRHRYAMMSVFAGALVIAGGFTLYPGRIMHRVVFGG